MISLHFLHLVYTFKDKTVKHSQLNEKFSKLLLLVLSLIVALALPVRPCTLSTKYFTCDLWMGSHSLSNVMCNL